MAEEVKDKERSVDKEPELLELIKSVRDQIEEDGQSNVKHVNERYSNKMGEFTYTQNGKRMMSNIMLVHVVSEKNKTGENRVYVYDEEGNYSELAREVYSTEDPTSRKMYKRNGAEFDEDQLSEQIEESKEQQRERDKQEAGTHKGGDGRDLPQEQHAEKKQDEQEEKKDDREEEQTQDGQSQEKLELLDEEIIGESPKIRLDTSINGYYLWQILQIQSDEFQNSLPEGVTAEEFRNGYLSFVDSKELEARDGKPREAKETFVISTYSGKTVELTTLEPKEMGTLQQQRQSQQSDVKSENGEMVDGPDTDMTLNRTSLYEIPNVHTQFNNGENWYLAVEDDKEYKEKAKIPTENKAKQISFGQLSRETSDYYRNERIGGDGTKSHPGAFWTKLESIEEPVLQNEGEGRVPQDRQENGQQGSNEKVQQGRNEGGQQAQLANPDPNESRIEIGKYMERIAQRCLNEHPEIGELYNLKDVTSLATEIYQTTGNNEEETIKAIVEECEQAAEIEHDQPGIDPRRGY